MTAAFAAARQPPPPFLAKPAHVTQTNLVRVVLWMVGALLSFSVMAVSIRLLAGHGLSIFEILTVRSGAMLVIMGALMLFQPQLRAAAQPPILRGDKRCLSHPNRGRPTPC